MFQKSFITLSITAALGFVQSVLAADRLTSSTTMQSGIMALSTSTHLRNAVPRIVCPEQVTRANVTEWLLCNTKRAPRKYL